MKSHMVQSRCVCRIEHHQALTGVVFGLNDNRIVRGPHEVQGRVRQDCGRVRQAQSRPLVGYHTISGRKDQVAIDGPISRLDEDLVSGFVYNEEIERFEIGTACRGAAQPRLRPRVRPGDNAPLPDVFSPQDAKADLQPRLRWFLSPTIFQRKVKLDRDVLNGSGRSHRSRREHRVRRCGRDHRSLFDEAENLDR